MRSFCASGKGRTSAREQALAHGHGTTSFSVLPGLLSRQLKHVTAELELVKEFRLKLDG